MTNTWLFLVSFLDGYVTRLSVRFSGRRKTMHRLCGSFTLSKTQREECWSRRIFVEIWNHRYGLEQKYQTKNILQSKRTGFSFTRWHEEKDQNSITFIYGWRWFRWWWLNFLLPVNKSSFEQDVLMIFFFSASKSWLAEKETVLQLEKICVTRVPRLQFFELKEWISGYKFDNYTLYCACCFFFFWYMLWLSNNSTKRKFDQWNVDSRCRTTSFLIHLLCVNHIGSRDKIKFHLNTYLYINGFSTESERNVLLSSNESSPSTHTRVYCLWSK